MKPNIDNTIDIIELLIRKLIKLISRKKIINKK